MAAVSPTASSPTGTTPALAAPPPGVGTFPTIEFSKDHVKVRWFDPNAATAVNLRWAGMPRGVYLGFVPTTTPGSRVLTLEVDPNHHFSLLKVLSSSERVMVDIFSGADLTLDFTGHNVWPVYVLATAVFQSRAPTQAKIFTRASAATEIDEITLCQVDKVGDNLVVDVAEPSSRQQPVAFQRQPYGYMPDGAIENLAATNATVAEVIAARSSTYTGGHASLGDRLDTDMSGEAIADRLGLRLVHLTSNVHPNRSGTSANVSGSFSETGRDYGPELTIEANGSESVEGAVTDSARNTCFVVNGTTGQRLIDEASREPVYGKVTYTETAIGVTKEVHFVNASTNVNGNGTNPFGPPLEEGDLLEGPDGLFYEVLDVVDPDNAILGAAYRGTDDAITNPRYRRWQLFFFTVAAGVYNLVVPTAVQFVFPCFYRLDRAIFDGLLLIKRDGERPQLPAATDAVLGKALLATSGGLVGSFRTVKNSGSSIGTDFHTLNFIYGGATNAGGGVANVSVPGAQGPTGPGAAQGPTGPTGPAGFGYSVNNSFETGPESGDTVTAKGTVTVSYTHDWTALSSVPTLSPLTPRSYAHVNCGWSVIDGFGHHGNERIFIDNLTTVDANRTQVTYRIRPEGDQSYTTIQCFMGASQ